MNMSNLKLSTRLILGFGTMGALIALLGGIALYKLSVVGDEFDLVMKDRYPKIVHVNEVKGGVNDAARAVRNLFIVADAADQKKEHDEIAAADKVIGNNLALLHKEITSQRGKTVLAELTAARAAYLAPRDKMLELLRTGKPDEAKPILLNELRPAQLTYMKRLDDLITYQSDLMVADGKTAEADVANTRTLVIALVLGALVAGCVIAFWIIRSTTKPLNDATQIARAVAAGDLAMEFQADGKSETGLLLGALHEMKTRLASIVGGVRANAESVATASAHIA
ncbi:MAG: chemotaxis protein, partial [Methylibium sp. NZG]